MSLWGKVKKAVKKVVKGVKKLWRVVQEVTYRLLGVLDLLLDLLGIRIKKFCKLRIIILKKDWRTPVQTSETVEQWLNRAKQVFKDRLNVELRPIPHDGSFIDIAGGPPSPDYLLNPAGCGFGYGFDDAADDFDDMADAVYKNAYPYEQLQHLIGYGEGIVAFVVLDHPTKNGCAYPWIQNFCWITSDAVPLDLPHEMGHLCGLFPHAGDKDNLMYHNADRGSKMTRWQISWVRASRHVAYLPR